MLCVRPGPNLTGGKKIVEQTVRIFRKDSIYVASETAIYS